MKNEAKINYFKDLIESMQRIKFIKMNIPGNNNEYTTQPI